MDYIRGVVDGSFKGETMLVTRYIGSLDIRLTLLGYLLAQEGPLFQPIVWLVKVPMVFADRSVWMSMGVYRNRHSLLSIGPCEASR